MKRIAIIAGLGLLAGCQEAPQPSSVGKYQIVTTMEGTVRINTETGKTDLMVSTDTPPVGTYAVRNDKPLVWAEVKNAVGY